MKMIILNTIMKNYLTYAPYSIFIVWIYVVVRGIKNLNQFRKASGKKTLSLLFNPFSLSTVNNERRTNAELEEAYHIYKKKSKEIVFIWILSVIAFTVITFAVGIISGFES